MNESNYSLQELHTMSGTTVRTIRDYIQRGLLRSAHGRGPKSYYDNDHLERLHAIGQLKDRLEFNLGEIRIFLSYFVRGDVQVLVQALPKLSKLDVTKIQASMEEGANATTAIDRVLASKSALRFIHSLKNRNTDPDREFNASPSRQKLPDITVQSELPSFTEDRLESEKQVPDDNMPWLGLNPPEKLLRILNNEIRTVSSRSRRREEWVQFEITPDIRLQIRGDFDIRQQAVFAQIADAIREILLGGTHDKDE